MELVGFVVILFEKKMRMRGFLSLNHDATLANVVVVIVVGVVGGRRHRGSHHRHSGCRVFVGF